MGVAKEWRDHASRLLARAQAARERGEAGLADLLTAAAMQYLGRAQRASFDAEEAPHHFAPEDPDPHGGEPQPQPKNNDDGKK